MASIKMKSPLPSESLRQLVDSSPAEASASALDVSMDDANDGNDGKKAEKEEKATAKTPGAVAAAVGAGAAATAAAAASSKKKKKKKRKAPNSAGGAAAAGAAGGGVASAASAASPRSNQSEKENGSSKKKAAAGASAAKTPKTPGSTTGGGTGGGGTPSKKGNTYVEMITEAIFALGDRTGSSMPAIAKWLGAHDAYGPKAGNPNFRKLLNQALKAGVKAERFTQAKASFKISVKWRDQERNRKRRQKAAAVAALKKKKLSRQKQKQKQGSAAKKPATAAEHKAHHEKKMAQLEEKKTLTPEEIEKEKVRMARKEKVLRLRAEAARKESKRLERIRKRRFPIEDTRLHAEDKELLVKPPPDVAPRPRLPYFWHLTRPLSDPSREGRTSHSILENSKVDTLDCPGTNGFIPDILGVYHFFRGDVHFSASADGDDGPIVPDFSLQNLVFATEQIVNGQARANRMIPPLIVHLFCSCLQLLCQEPPGAEGGSNGTIAATGLPVGSNRVSASRRRLQEELHKYLSPVLTPASWADVCFLYMDAMERYSTTDASRDPSVLKPLNIDLEYLLGRADHPDLPMTPPPTNRKAPPSNANAAGAATTTAAGDDDNNSSSGIEDGYYGYLGDSSGALFKAHHKLFRQDPWSLTAEEILALLRSLTDDVLANHPAAGQDIGAREDEMQELLRAKRSADAKFRKVRVAFEGPKRPVKKAPTSTATSNTTTTTTTNADGDKKAAPDNDGKEDAEAKEETAKEEEPAFKPTATKKQFEAVTKAQQKASDAYEKGIRKLVSRTEPIGYDRNFNAVYCFRHDPQVLYVEDLKPPASTVATNLPEDMQFARRSWHIIETTSLFDTFATSLDIRGKREHDLYEEMLGPQGAQQSLRRYLHDDLKERAEANARLKEKEALKKKLEIARLKCNEEQGRRSGRLAGQAEGELMQVEREIEALERRIEGDKGNYVEDTRDFEELTGLKVLRQFDTVGKMETRRSREKKQSSNANANISSLHCSKLVSSGNIDGSGIVGMLVAGILELEEHCESLAPWEQGFDRSAWIAQLEGAVHAWNSAATPAIGTPGATRYGGSATPASAARQPMRQDSLDSAASSSSSKKRRVESPAPPSTTSQAPTAVSSIISMLKQPLLDLEKRVADMTNLAVAARDADLADDNMSTDSSEEDQANKERLERAWKKLIHKIRSTPTKKHVQIRELIVSAISAARKAHLPEIVAQLRAALLLHHPSAAWDCKAAAIEVLQANGDYEEEEDDMGSDDEEEANEEAAATAEAEEVPSVICAEAAVTRSSLGGSDDSTRADWIDGVKASKTISRLASMAAGFVHDATEKVRKIEVEHADLVDALARWEKDEERRIKNEAANKKTSSKEFAGPSEVWANVEFTDEICMAKAEDYPSWPAKKCTAKDPGVAESLSKVNRCLVSLVGEMGALRVVKTDGLKPFIGKTSEDDDLADVPKNTRNQLEDCLAMARRILRGSQKKVGRKKARKN